MTLISRDSQVKLQAMALGRHPFRSPSNDTTHTIYTDSRSRFFVGRPNRLPPENSSESHTSHGSSAQVIRTWGAISVNGGLSLDRCARPRLRLVIVIRAVMPQPLSKSFKCRWMFTTHFALRIPSRQITSLYRLLSVMILTSVSYQDAHCKDLCFERFVTTNLY